MDTTHGLPFPTQTREAEQTASAYRFLHGALLHGPSAAIASLGLAAVLAFSACGPTPTASPTAPQATVTPQTAASPTPTSTAAPPSATPTPTPQIVLRAEPVVQGVEWVTALAFAPDGRLFFTERLKGTVRVFQDGQLSPEPVVQLPVVSNLPEAGLLGLALHPDFSNAPWVYVYYTYRQGQSNLNQVARFPLEGQQAGPLGVVLDKLPAAGIHNGGAIAFGPDRLLYVPVGDTTQRDAAQAPVQPAGKVHRVRPDGGVPDDNPFPGSTVYTLGHRNMFGIAFHPQTGRPYITENGPNVDDELNLLRPGGNYGWPRFTGVANDPRYVDPLLTYTPNIAPTGIAFYTGDKLPPQYSGRLFFGDYNTGSLHMVELGGPAQDQVVRQEVVLRLLGEGIISVANGPDGYLYLGTRRGIHRVVAVEIR
ncbi:MAG: PQQ-dependent sugar dehydrogenase [Chloroflexi bacterium]|nr:PQQ-dependent sugar dehydrogenase [Chloroflexota bacterium]